MEYNTATIVTVSVVLRLIVLQYHSITSSKCYSDKDHVIIQKLGGWCCASGGDCSDTGGGVWSFMYTFTFMHNTLIHKGLFRNDVNQKMIQGEVGGLPKMMDAGSGQGEGGDRAEPV